MAGVNTVILLGHVGKDSELRFTQNGNPVANFSLATSETYGKGEDRKEQTEWHNIVCWGRQAEIAGQYIKKGRQVFVEGRLQTKNWTDPQGVKHYRTEIVCRNFQLLGGRSDNDGYTGSQGDGYSSQGYESQTAKAPAQKPQDGYDIGDLGPPLDMDDFPAGGN